jgi:hypothetical protein
VFFLGLVLQAAAHAGMPAVLPSGWTAASRTPDSGAAGPSQAAPYLQAISFFVVLLLGSAWAVKGLWSVLRREWIALPELTYWRSLSLVVLWGLLFVVVLTMISGARELMTPGAWRKQGWTYKLAETAPQGSAGEERRRGLEQLRQSLWQYAATHSGEFPPAVDAEVPPALWKLPGWPGLRFLYVPGRRAEEAGRLLVFEPAAEGDARLVLLTNGLIGTMTSAEIEAAVKKANEP